MCNERDKGIQKIKSVILIDKGKGELQIEQCLLIFTKWSDRRDQKIERK